MIDEVHAAVSEATRRLLGAAAVLEGDYTRALVCVADDENYRKHLVEELRLADNVAVTNIGAHLSAEVLEHPISKRASATLPRMLSIVQDQTSDIVVLDHIEVLFTRELHVDPLRVLRRLARDRTVIAIWPGLLRGQTLTYAEPEHSEYYEASSEDLMVIVAKPPTGLFPDPPAWRGTP